METGSPISISCPFALPPLPLEQEGTVSSERAWPCGEKPRHHGPDASCLPRPPGPWFYPDPSPAARLPPPCRPRGISCQRPWSRSPSLGLSPSHSRAAESCEKNAAGREGLPRTERLCGGNCCSALSRPRPPGGAAPSAANAKPGARRAGAARGREGAGAWGGTGGLLSHPRPPLPTQQAEDGAQTGWVDGSEPRASRPGACPHAVAGGLGPQSGLFSRSPHFGEWTHEVPGLWLRPHQHKQLAL